MKRHGTAWILLALALALHVADEAANDFLSVYNPTVLRMKQALPWLPLPVFTFDVWLAGLIAAVVLLLFCSRFVFLGQHWTVPASYLLGGLMALNAFGHFAGSVAMGRAMPGVYSSPILLAAALFLIFSTRQKRPGPASGAGIAIGTTPDPVHRRSGPKG
jgi:hypothetical protein